METYNASEGFFAIQDDPKNSDMLLMLDYGYSMSSFRHVMLMMSIPTQFHYGKWKPASIMPW